MSLIAAAGIGALGSVISSSIGANSAKAVSADNYAASREAMQNKHQWEVEDLKKAGLNPIISAHGSTGTTSGTGVSFTPENPLANFAQLKIANDRAKAEINSAYAQAHNTEVDTARKQFDLARDYYNMRNFIIASNANTARAVQEANNAAKQGRLIDSNISAVEANTARARAEQPAWNLFGDIVNSATDFGREALNYISDAWDKGYRRTNDTSKNKRSGIIAHLDRGGTFANYK